MNLPQESHAITHHEPERGLSTWLTPQSFEAAEKIAALMATCGTMPKHLSNKGDCFRVVVQAAKWRMDPFTVGECTSLVHGRMCYEGKLVAAVLSAMNSIEGRLQHDVTGEGQKMSIKVTGKVRGGRLEVYVGTVENLRTRTFKDGKELKNAWDNDPHSMLIYRATRQWARLYAPEAIMGIYTPDEMENAKEVEGVVVGAEPIAARTVEQQNKNAAPPVEEQQRAVEVARSAKQASPAHPAIEAARKLYTALGKDAGMKAIGRLCKLAGVAAPKDVPADKLDQFGKDVAQLDAAKGDAARIEDLLSAWEQAVPETKAVQP